MGISANAAAQLIWRARGKLRVALTAGAVASVVATSEECEWAQLLLSKAQDGEPVEAADRAWLEEHLEECGSCQTANRMLLAAGASYRMWVPVALLAGMRADTLAAAGGVLGADWSGAAGPERRPARPPGPARPAGARRGGRRRRNGDRGGGNRLPRPDGQRQGQAGERSGRAAGGRRAGGAREERPGAARPGEGRRALRDACSGAGAARCARRG